MRQALSKAKVHNCATDDVRILLIHKGTRKINILKWWKDFEYFTTNVMAFCCPTTHCEDEAAGSSETSRYFNQTTRRNFEVTPEN